MVLAHPQSRAAQDIYFEEIQKVRQGDNSNLHFLREFVEIFAEIRAKDSNRLVEQTLNAVEAHYLAQATDYYRLKFKELEGLACGEYLREVNALLSKEEEIFRKCYDYPRTRELLKREFGRELVLKYNDNLLEKSTGLLAMLENKQVEHLKLLNELYKKLDCFSETIRLRFREHFEKELAEFLKDKSAQLQELEGSGGTSREKVRAAKIELIKELFSFNREKHELFEECFPGNVLFLSLYKLAVKKVLNQPNEAYNISQTLALYSDHVLRRRNLEWEQFQEELRQIFVIFNFLSDKDIFIKDYSEYLASRLIKGHSDDDTKDQEKSFVAKLKEK